MRRLLLSSELAWCRAPHPKRCPYALPFADAHFCRHPERASFPQLED